MILPADRLDRFARHIVLPEVGGAGQVRLAEARVAVIGLGGIGSPALQYLAASGIGRLTLVDDDVVDVERILDRISPNVAAAALRRLCSPPFLPHSSTWPSRGVRSWPRDESRGERDRM